LVRQPVAGREVTQPAGVGGVPRTDDREARAEGELERAADQEPPQDQVGQPRVSRNHLAQFVDRDGEHQRRVLGHRGEEQRLPDEQAEIAEEAARTVDSDHAPLQADVLDHHDIALEHDEELVRRLARPLQRLPLADRTTLTHGGQLDELVLLQPWIGAVQVGGLLGHSARGLLCPTSCSRPCRRFGSGSLVRHTKVSSM
jgi:hypothetical protein